MAVKSITGDIPEVRLQDVMVCPPNTQQMGVSEDPRASVRHDGSR